MAAGYPRPTQEGGVARTARCRRFHEPTSNSGEGTAAGPKKIKHFSLVVLVEMRGIQNEYGLRHYSGRNLG